MSPFPGHRAPVLRVQAGVADDGGCPVTGAARIPVSRRFPQWPQRLPLKGCPVTLAVQPPRLPAGERDDDAGDRGHPRAQLAGLPRGAPSRVWRAGVADTAFRRSSASATLTAPACTDCGTRYSDDGAARAWASSPDRRRGRELLRILRLGRRYAAAVKPGEWISRPPPSGSRSGRRQSPNASRSGEQLFRARPAALLPGTQ